MESRPILYTAIVVVDTLHRATFSSNFHRSQVDPQLTTFKLLF